MKFNIEEIYNNSKDDLGFNTLTKYIIVLSFVLGLLSIFTFAPVNNINFLLDIIGYICRYGSLVIYIMLFINIKSMMKYQVSINKHKYLYIGLFIFFISHLIYLFCFCINILSLFS